MFRSVHEALQFAFRTLGSPIIKLSGINAMRGGGGYGELTPHDRHAQAALILSIVERAVDVNGLAYLKAQYGHELRGGEHERGVANHLVQVVVCTLPTGCHNRRGVEKLVRIYFGQDISLVSVRKDLACGHAKANEYRDMVHRALGAIGERAEYAADDVLRQARHVGVEEMAG